MLMPSANGSRKWKAAGQQVASDSSARRRPPFLSAIGRRSGRRSRSRTIDHRLMSLEPRGTYRSNPPGDFGGILLVHVEEVGHCGPHGLHAGVVECHRYLAVKDLEQGAVQVFD